MDVDGRGMLGARWEELNELDRLLSQLARPSRLGARVPHSVRAELRAKGVFMSRGTRREQLIESVWSRKRPLLRQLHSMDDPLPPCA